MFSSTTIAALVIGMVLAFLIPIAAVIVFKLRNRDSRLPSALVGAVTFIVFAMLLEQLLHSIMLPVVQGSKAAYIIYGALAAGIFEETGRLAAYKTVMKNNYSTPNAIMMGLGHGGCEMILVLGFSLISLVGCATMVNSQGLDATVKLLTEGNPQSAEATRAQIEQLTAYGFGTMALSIYERLIAMTFHVCMSVLVYHAVTQNGKMYMYALAVALHAALDVPAVMYQVGMLSIPVCYIIMTVLTAAVVWYTITVTKKFSGYEEL